MDCTFEVRSKNSLPNPRPWIFSPTVFLATAVLIYNSCTVQFIPFKVYSSMVISIFPGSCNHHHNLFLDSFITPGRNPVPFKYHLPTPHSIPLSPRQQLIYFLSQWICLFWAFHKNEIIEYVVLVPGFFPLAECLQFIHVIVWKSTSFLFVAEL